MLRVQQRISDLTRAAEQDPLTGIGNRRHVEMKLESALMERRMHGTAAGVLFLDVDHFKRVNDVYGHDVGDAVLRMVAKTLDRNVRGSDAVGRWGGEEFVALVVGVNEAGLEVAAEKLRTLVAASSLDSEHGAVRVTVSVGATLARVNDTLETLVRRADRLLYQSKEAGRDRVSLAA
jgi:diguanylate cyclase (GGDEF)-like protein